MGLSVAVPREGHRGWPLPVAGLFLMQMEDTQRVPIKPGQWGGGPWTPEPRAGPSLFCFSSRVSRVSPVRPPGPRCCVLSTASPDETHILSPSCSWESIPGKGSAWPSTGDCDKLGAVAGE